MTALAEPEKTPAETAKAPVTAISADLFARFVDWIGRTPRTARAYITNLRQFGAYLAYRGIDRPCRADVLSYRDWLTGEHEAIRQDGDRGWAYRDAPGSRITCTAATVRAYMQSVRAFFKWTAAEGLYPDIASNIHAPAVARTHRRDALPAGAVTVIERAIDETARRRSAGAQTAGEVIRTGEQERRIRALFLLAVTAGLRCCELARANVRDFVDDPAGAVLYVWGKGHAEPDQRIPLAPAVGEALREYVAGRQDRPGAGSPLFVATGNRSGGRRLDPCTISKMLKAAMAGAGYRSDRLTAHSLRHTAGTAAMEVTGDIYAAQTFMRHQSPVTTEIYLHNKTETRQRQIAGQVYDALHGTQEGSARERLEAMIDRLTPAALEQLTGIAAVLC